MHLRQYELLWLRSCRHILSCIRIKITVVLHPELTRVKPVVPWAIWMVSRCTMIYIGAWNTSSRIWSRLIIQKVTCRRLRVYAYMIDGCESIVLLRQRIQGEKLIRSGWGLPKKNLSRNGENSSLFAQNRLLCHWCTSKLCPCAFYFNDRFDIKKKEISRAFRSLDSFFRFRRECAERRDWGEENNIRC